jgi:3-hydroxybutyrate dehydrogenase
MFIGKTALVTGSTSGIGLGIARTLAAQGANIVLHGFGDRAATQGLQVGLAEEFNVQVRHDGADMSRPEAIEDMMGKALAEFGCIDLLVNNAGIQHVAPADECPVDKWYAILAIDQSSSLHTTRLALPAMKKKGYGRIVNIASAHALVASPFKSACVTARHGVAGFTKTVALEVAEAGITVNAVCPGYVLTPLAAQQIPATAGARGISNGQVIHEVLLAAQATRKFVTVEQVAALTAFLCSDDAASVTGAILPIEGGWTAH